MARLAAALVATAPAPLWRLKTQIINQVMFGRVAGAAVNLLAELGQLTCQGVDFVAELLMAAPIELGEPLGIGWARHQAASKTSAGR